MAEQHFNDIPNSNSQKIDAELEQVNIESIEHDVNLWHESDGGVEARPAKTSRVAAHEEAPVMQAPTATFHIEVDGIAEPATLIVKDSVGVEDTAISLDITATLNDVDGSESLSVTILGVPVGATLSAGVDNSDGSWTLTPAVGQSEDFELTIQAISQEDDGNIAIHEEQIDVEVIDTSGVTVINGTAGDYTIIADSSDDTI